LVRAIGKVSNPKVTGKCCLSTVVSANHVPYTGAVNDLDMGSYTVTAGSFIGDGSQLEDTRPSILIIETDCTIDVEVGDAVYVSSDDVVKRANNSSIDTAQVVGFVLEKPTASTAYLILSGVVSLFSGLTPGKKYFLDEFNGQITDIPPSDSGSVIVHVGQAITSSTLLVGLSNVYTIRS